MFKEGGERNNGQLKSCINNHPHLNIHKSQTPSTGLEKERRYKSQNTVNLRKSTEPTRQQWLYLVF